MDTSRSFNKTSIRRIELGPGLVHMKCCICKCYRLTKCQKLIMMEWQMTWNLLCPIPCTQQYDNQNSTKTLYHMPGSFPIHIGHQLMWFPCFPCAICKILPPGVLRKFESWSVPNHSRHTNIQLVRINLWSKQTWCQSASSSQWRSFRSGNDVHLIVRQKHLKNILAPLPIWKISSGIWAVLLNCYSWIIWSWFQGIR